MKLDGRRFRRRVVLQCRLPDGTPNTIVIFAEHPAPACADLKNERIRVQLTYRQFCSAVDLEVLSVDARDIGGPEDRLDAWEERYRSLHRHAENWLDTIVYYDSEADT
jgi:hypothetical protein